MKKIIALTAFFAPMAAMAATISSVITTASDIVRMIVPILITIALIIFIWGIIKYITAGDDEENRGKARNIILYGIIGLFAIVAVWGLVALIRNTFGITETTVDTPQYRF